ncbi:hypothetical protein Ccrd_010614 [Cynara cardunculus var. scolymus]|uniref:Uncharacterized protein n=1 Tax=Cynara cardunculus var. scolymus TaxID=59895 RepID=A0A118K6P3_CYNCS|nr:hypothetical protein Ccrd_010614 [Cynara cardunculus var. scolymus]
MERTEPTFVPEWLKSSGGSSTTSHQFTSSSLHPGNSYIYVCCFNKYGVNDHNICFDYPSDGIFLAVDEQGSSKSGRNKSSVNSSDNDLGRTSVSDRTTSSYFRRTSLGNGSTHLRSYSSFGRNHRDRDWDKDIYEFWSKEKSDNRHRDYSDPLDNILPSRFEKDGLRRSHSSVSGKRGESWPRKVVSDLSIANKSSHSNGTALLSGGSSLSNVKTSFERDFPSLGADEKQADPDIGRVPSPGLSSAIQSLPIGNSAVIGGDGWTSALAEVPVIVGSNGNSTSVSQPVQPTSITATTSMTGGRNMAETLAHGPPRTQTAPQVAQMLLMGSTILTVGTQRLEELAVKQSRQLIPMTPSMPKALALSSSDKPKLKIGQSQLVNHPHTPRPLSVKSDVSKTSTVGKLLVLKPSRERNGISPTAKESLSPTGGSKLPNSPLAVPSAIGSAPLRNMGNNPGVTAVERKPSVATLEKRPSSQAQSRNNFFNLMRKKSMISNSSVAPDTGSSVSSSEKPGAPVAPPAHLGGSESNTTVETKVDLTCKGDACVATVRSTNNGKNHSGPDAVLCSEEEEARFLRSLGWDETAEEEEGLTEEEISSFYRNYLNLKPTSKILKGTKPKPLMEISSDSKLDS